MINHSLHIPMYSSVQPEARHFMSSKLCQSNIHCIYDSQDNVSLTFQMSTPTVCLRSELMLFQCEIKHYSDVQVLRDSIQSRSTLGVPIVTLHSVGR